MSDRDFQFVELLRDWPVENFGCFILRYDTDKFWFFGDQDRVFRYASVTKLASTLAFLSAISEGVIDLDQVIATGAVVKDLLAHASGLPGEIRPNLSIFDHKPIVAPRSKRIYSNLGFELLAETLSLESTIDFRRYFSEAVLESVRMVNARIDGASWPGAGDSGAAAGLSGTIQDLAQLALGLVHGTPYIDADLLAEAKTPYLPELPGILPGFGEMRNNCWGLGLEIKGHKSPHWTSSLNSPETFGHFGAAGTFLWVDSSHKMALGVLTDRAFGPWAQKQWPSLSTRAIELYA